MSDTEALIAEIEARLDAIPDPCSIAMGDRMSLVEMGLIENIAIDQKGCARITMCLTDTSCVHFNGMVAYICEALLPMNGVEEVRVDHVLDRIWTDERIRRKVS